MCFLCIFCRRNVVAPMASTYPRAQLRKVACLGPVKSSYYFENLSESLDVCFSLLIDCDN